MLKGYSWLYAKKLFLALGTIWNARDQTEVRPGQPCARQTSYSCDTIPAAIPQILSEKKKQGKKSERDG